MSTRSLRSWSSLLRISCAYSPFMMLLRWVLLIPSSSDSFWLLRSGRIVSRSMALFTSAVFFASLVSIWFSMVFYWGGVLYGLHVYSVSVFYVKPLY